MVPPVVQNKLSVFVFVTAKYFVNGSGYEFRPLAALLTVFLGFLSTFSTHTRTYVL